MAKVFSDVGDIIRDSVDVNRSLRAVADVFALTVSVRIAIPIEIAGSIRLAFAVIDARISVANVSMRGTRGRSA